MAEKHTVNFLPLEMAVGDIVLQGDVSTELHRKIFIHVLSHHFCLFYLLSFVSCGQSSPSLRGSSLQLGKFFHGLVLGQGCRGRMVLKAEAVISLM